MAAELGDVLRGLKKLKPGITGGTLVIYRHRMEVAEFFKVRSFGWFAIVWLIGQAGWTHNTKRYSYGGNADGKVYIERSDSLAPFESIVWIHNAAK